MLFNNTNISCDQMAASSSTPITMSSRICLYQNSSNSVTVGSGPATTITHSNNILDRSHHHHNINNNNNSHFHYHHHHNHHHHQHTVSPQSSDQNCDRHHVPAKGIKRRNDSIEGTPVVLGLVSTNIAHQLAYQRNDSGASVSVLASGHSRCSPDKCSSYHHSPCHENIQQIGNIQGPAKQDEDHNNDDGSNNNNEDACDMGCDGEDYDYDTILAKILNEKKLALSNSPEVIEYLQAVPKKP